MHVCVYVDVIELLPLTYLLASSSAFANFQVHVGIKKITQQFPFETPLQGVGNLLFFFYQDLQIGIMK